MFVQVKLNFSNNGSFCEIDDLNCLGTFERCRIPSRVVVVKVKPYMKEWTVYI